jgi:hypothetical protein
MAKTLTHGVDEREINELIVKSTQSGNLNFLLGSGASTPALPLSGQIEAEVSELFRNGNDREAKKRLTQFLSGLMPVNNALIDPSLIARDVAESDVEFSRRTGPINLTRACYSSFLGNVEHILEKRKTSLLRKHANIFTTNYDLFIEDAAESFPALRVNDGFLRGPSLKTNFCFSTQGFFNSVSNCGNLYNYKVEIPSVSLIKIHGSFTWKRTDNSIVCEVRTRNAISPTAADEEIDTFLEQFCLVLPQQGKFRETLIDQWYYELLRLYSNELDKEGTVLFSSGFSFEDGHIQEITKRALKNSSLILVLFAYSLGSAERYRSIFLGYNNVVIIQPTGSENIDFAEFNNIFEKSLQINRFKAEE